MDRKKILLIEDETVMAQLFKTRIESMGSYEVFMAENGANGLDAAKRLKPDLIFLDILLPDIDGFEVLKRLKKSKNTANIPVVMLTALSDEKSKIKAVESFSEGYLVKPVEPGALKTKIEEVLKRRTGA